MRASRRRLLFGFSYIVFVLLLFVPTFDTHGQGIAGLPGSTSDAALGRGVSDNKLGSVLFFNYYVSDALSSQVNTRINITNVHATQDIIVHVFFVDSATCNIADAFNEKHMHDDVLCR